MRTSRVLLLASIVAAPLTYAACGDDDATTDTTTDAGVDASTSGDTGAGSDAAEDAGSADTSTGDGGVQRGPVSFDFDSTGNGDPISLLWDDGKSVLYIADNKNNQVWSWTDTAGFKKLVKVLADPVADDAGRQSLGQIVKLSDGTLVVPRFGGPGTATVGAILYVDPVSGDAGKVPGVDPTRKRTALAVGPGDQMFGGTFLTPGDGKGVVTKDTLAGETDYAVGFEKPVGVAVQNGRLLVSEQQKGIIYSLPLDGGFTDGGPYEIFANVPSCDALTTGPNGSVITGQFRPLVDGGPLQVRQAFSDGGVTVLHPTTSFAKPQGVAYDPTHKRLFVADSNGTTVRTIKILPVE